MAAPKKPNNGPAKEVRLRQGDETAARRLRRRGWLVFPPEVLKLLPEDKVKALVALSKSTKEE